MRVFAECDSATTAEAISTQVLAALSSLDVVAEAAPKPYWKISQYFEFTFSALPADDASRQQIINLCAEGWVHHRDEHDCSSVWNKTGEESFLALPVKWAEVQLHA